MKKVSPSGKKSERVLKKWATCRPAGCQRRTSPRSRSKRMSRRTIGEVVIRTSLCYTKWWHINLGYVNSRCPGWGRVFYGVDGEGRRVDDDRGAVRALGSDNAQHPG